MAPPSPGSPRVRIIADDLTGAADAAIAFAEQAEAAAVLLETDAPEWTSPSGSVTAVDLATRDGDGGNATARLSEALAVVRPGEQLMKKIDSTLRGHVASEVELIASCFADRVVVVVPAFPGAGRTTLGGVQHVNGVPLHRSGAWDAERLAPPASLVELLGTVGVRHVPLDEVRGGVDAILGRVEAAGSSGRVLVCDTERDDDLDTIVAGVMRSERGAFWVGSAGLSGALARWRAGLRPCIEGSPLALPERAPVIGWRQEDRLLAVFGSASEIGRRQARSLASGRGGHLLVLAVSELCSASDEELDGLAADLRARSLRGDVVLTVGGALLPERSRDVARALARVAMPAAREVGLLALTGGATARAVLEACGVVALRLIAQPETGVVLASAAGGLDNYVLTKAGAFGDGDTFLRCVDKISSMGRG